MSIHLTSRIAGIEIDVETHRNPDGDEIVALWLAEKFGTADWVAAHCPNRCLQLGVGGGEFDEHPVDGRIEKHGETCVTLMAKSLGVYDDQAVRHVIDPIVLADDKGKPYELYRSIKRLHVWKYPDRPQEVAYWAFDQLDAQYAERQEVIATVAEVKASGRLITLADERTGTAQNLLILVIESDRLTIVEAASILYDKKGLGAIIARRSDGYTQVWSKRRAGLKLAEAVRLLRIAEARAAGQKEELNEGYLRKPGFAAGDKVWYYAIRGQMILNGSLTTDNVPKTILSLETVIDCVVKGIERWMNSAEAKAAAVKKDKKS